VQRKPALSSGEKASSILRAWLGPESGLGLGLGLEVGLGLGLD
jgi:hypothetical protein